MKTIIIKYSTVEPATGPSADTRGPLCISARIVIQTTSGDVRGKLIRDKTTGTSYYAYRGIPYAQPPVGELRFKPPVPKQRWNGVYDATKPGRVCPQREEYYTRDQMSEDCLVYNVFVPSNITSTLLPVIFHFHGGYFDSLSGNTEPLFGIQLLVRKNVVVTLNCRLGALGYLSMCNEEVSGNNGLKDAILALKIVHDNIKKFGGDPNKITLLGTGAGAAMVELLMFTNETTGLFCRVSAQSGTAFSLSYLQFYPRQNAMSLAREMGIQYCNDTELIKELQCADAFDLVNATEAIIRKDPQRGYRIGSPFTPTVETVNKYAVLTESPIELMRKGAVQDVPRVVSVNNQAGMNILTVLRDETELIDKFNAYPELFIPEYIQYPKGSLARVNLAERIKAVYMNGYNVSIATIANYINLCTDVFSIFPSDLSVQMFSERKQSPVYYDVCAFDTELNYLKAAENITYPGCAHVDEIGYEFITNVTRSKYQNMSPVARRLQNAILKSVDSYAATGNPSVTVAQPAAGPGRYHIEIYNYATVIVYSPPYPERMAFWRSVYDDYLKSEYNIGYYCINPDARSVL